jgi:hypothetical protein
MRMVGKGFGECGLQNVGVYEDGWQWVGERWWKKDGDL